VPGPTSTGQVQIPGPQGAGFFPTGPKEAGSRAFAKGRSARRAALAGILMELPTCPPVCLWTPAPPT
jgi:hypothetical protein